MLDPVVHPFRLPPHRHEAGTAKIGKVSRDLGLALAEDFAKIAHADLTFGKKVEKPKPGPVGKRTEQFRRLRLSRCSCGSGSHIWINIYEGRGIGQQEERARRSLLPDLKRGGQERELINRKSCQTRKRGGRFSAKAITASWKSLLIIVDSSSCSDSGSMVSATVFM